MFLFLITYDLQFGWITQQYEPEFKTEDKALSFELRFKSKKKVRSLDVNGQFL
jgi:hypothetical protein